MKTSSSSSSTASSSSKPRLRPSLDISSQELRRSQQNRKQQQQPFLMSRVVQASGEKRAKLCAKCEDFARGMSGDGDGSSIHSTLAYSRCRCHRLFQYRKQRLANTTARAEEARTTTTTTTGAYDEGVTNKQQVLQKGRKRGGFQTELMFRRSNELPKVENKVREVASSKSKDVLDPTTLVDHTVHNHSLKSKTNASPSACALPSVSLLPEIQTQKHLSPQQQKKQQQHNNIDSSSLCLPAIPSVKSLPSSKSLPPSKREVQRSRPSITDLVGLVKFIDSPKKKHLREVFREIDKNGDGHISCSEFLGSLPYSKLNNISALKQLYVILSDATYFGCREFMLCYSIAERLDRMRVHVVTDHLSQEFMELALIPVMKLLAKSSSNGCVNLQNIKDSYASVNRELGKCAINFSSCDLIKITSEGQYNLLDFLALSLSLSSHVGM